VADSRKGASVTAQGRGRTTINNSSMRRVSGVRICSNKETSIRISRYHSRPIHLKRH